MCINNTPTLIHQHLIPFREIKNWNICLNFDNMTRSPHAHAGSAAHGVFLRHAVTYVAVTL